MNRREGLVGRYLRNVDVSRQLLEKVKQDPNQEVSVWGARLNLLSSRFGYINKGLVRKYNKFIHNGDNSSDYSLNLVSRRSWESNDSTDYFSVTPIDKVVDGYKAKIKGRKPRAKLKFS